MSKIVTLTDLKHDDEQKIKTTLGVLQKKINQLKIDEFKNKRYIEALEKQVKDLSKQLKEIKQEPKLNLVNILREVNEDTMKEQGMTKKEIEDLDKEIEQKIKGLMT